MSTAGRSRDGKPASSDSVRLDGGDAADGGSAQESATAVASRPDGGGEADLGTDIAEQPAQAAGQRADSARQDRASRQGRTVLGVVGSYSRRGFAPLWVRHVVLVLAYLGAGIWATWPRFTYLADGKLPKAADVASFVWGFWWVAHQIIHLGNPFFTKYMAAPVGVQLGFSTMMPLAGYLMAPVTWIWGPSAAFTVVSLLTPGLLCYVMFRAARLWLNVPGSIAAGGFFGLSSMILWQVWYHINIAVGLIFVLMAIEAAVRLRRSQRIAAGIWLGIALGGAVMTSQEGGAIALVLAALILVPWLIVKLVKDRATLSATLLPLALGAALALLIASPQLVAMAQQIKSGGARVPVGTLAVNYTQFGASLPTLFAPSPRLTYFGLGQLASAYSFTDHVQVGEGLPTFGAVVCGLALLGLLIGWRKRVAWAFALLWIGCALLALGTSLNFGNCNLSDVKPGIEWGRHCQQFIPLRNHIHYALVVDNGIHVWKPVTVSNLMPYSWLVRIPGLAGLREADRFALVGLIGAAMLAGLVVQWLSKLSKRKVAVPLIAVVLALGVLEAGWAGGTDGPPFSPTETMPTAMPSFDSTLVADHSRSVVLDVPFGLRGGLSLTGAAISERALVLATEDGHPRAVSYTAWVPRPTITAIEKHPFFKYLLKYQGATSYPKPHELKLAAADLKTLHIGWVIEWANLWRSHHPMQRLAKLETYLHKLGFRRKVLACLVPSKPGTICGGQRQGEGLAAQVHPGRRLPRPVPPAPPPLTSSVIGPTPGGAGSKAGSRGTWLACGCRSICRECRSRGDGGADGGGGRRRRNWGPWLGHGPRLSRMGANRENPRTIRRRPGAR